MRPTALISIALVAWLGVIAQTVRAQETVGLDIYLLLDKSASISNLDATCKRQTNKDCWSLMVDFVESLIGRLGQVTGGISEDGLHVGILSFSCRSTVPITKSVIVPASGDIPTYDAGIVRLRNGNPSGGTCPSEGLEIVHDSIKNTPGLRPKVVLMLTDGLIENQDSNRAMEAGRLIREQGAMMFTASVGRPETAADRQKQQSQLVGLSGDASRVFGVEDAKSLNKIVDLISALAFDRFEANFTSDVLSNSEWCLSPGTTVALAGPSVDHIEFGPTVSQSLVCTFSSIDNSTFAETIATHSSTGLSCIVPNEVFWIAQDPATGMFSRKTVLGLTLIENETNMRRALKFSTNMTFPLSEDCLQLNWDSSRCLNEPLNVNFRPRPFDPHGVATCVARYSIRRVDSILPEFNEMRVNGITNSNTGEYTCTFPFDTLDGTANLESLSLTTSKNLVIDSVVSLPRYQSCFMPVVESTGCYGSSIAHTFDLTEEMASQFQLGDGHRCFLQSTNSSQFTEVPRTGALTCSLPPFSSGIAILATPSNMVLFESEFDGTSQSYSTDCFSAYVVQSEEQCLSASEPAVVVFEGRAINILNEAFQSEPFECQFTTIAGITETSEIIKKDDETWTCLFPSPTKSKLLDRTFNEVTLVRTLNDDALFISDLDIQDQDLCLDLETVIGGVAQDADDVIEICWGEEQVRIDVEGESLDLLSEFYQVWCEFTLKSPQGRTLDSRLATFIDDKASCEVPRAFVERNVEVNNNDMTIELEIIAFPSSLDPSKNFTMATKAFYFYLNGCAQMETASNLRACWGSSDSRSLQFVNVARPLSTASRLGFSDIQCKISSNYGELITTSPLVTDSSNNQASCAFSSELYTQRSSNERRDLVVSLTGYKGNSVATDIAAFALALMLTDDCYKVLPSSQASVCYGESWTLNIESQSGASLGDDATCRIASYIVPAVQQSANKWTCEVDTKLIKTEETTFSVLNSYQQTIIGDHPLPSPRISGCMSLVTSSSRGQSSCMSAESTGQFVFEGLTAGHLGEEKDDVACIFGNGRPADETLVKAKYVPTYDSYQLVCEIPAWPLFSSAEGFIPFVRFSTLRIAILSTDQTLYQSAISMADDNACLSLSYSSSRPECRTSNEIDAKVALQGTNIDHILGLNAFLSCAFSDHQNDNEIVLVTPEISEDGITCTLATAAAQNRPLSRLRLLAKTEDSEYQMPVPVMEASIVLGTSECFDEDAITDLRTALCDLLEEQDSSELRLRLSGTSVQAFQSSKPFDCALTDGTGKPILRLSGSRANTDVFCQGNLALTDVEVLANSDNFMLTVDGRPVKLLEGCPSSDKSGSSGAGGVAAGVVVSLVVLFAGFVGYRKYKDRQGRPATNNDLSTSTGFVFGDPALDGEREAARVKSLAKHGPLIYWDVFRPKGAETSITPISSAQIGTPADKSNTNAIRQSVHLDAPLLSFPWSIAYVPDWLMEFVSSPQSALAVLRPMPKMEVTVRSPADNEWGESVHDVLDDPVTLLPGDLIRVSVDPRQGLGMSLGRTAAGHIVVERFTMIKENTAEGPVEASGVVWANDQLVEVDDVSVKGWPLSRISRVIRSKMNNERIAFAFKSGVTKSFLGYGAYQLVVPRGVHLGIRFLQRHDLVVSSINKYGPLRSVVTLGSRLTAIDGNPVETEDDVITRLALDERGEVTIARLRFEAPRTARGRATTMNVDRPPLSPYAY